MDGQLGDGYPVGVHYPKFKREKNSSKKYFAIYIIMAEQFTYIRLYP